MPSSKFLADRMVSKVDFRSAKIIVELGPGTGVVTKEMLSRMRPDARLIAIETNDAFCDMLEKLRDERLVVVRLSAERLPEILDGGYADAIVSGIPLASLGKRVSGEILDAVKGSLAPHGVFVQFQYSKLSRRMIEDRFSSVSMDFVPINVPPAFVYTARH